MIVTCLAELNLRNTSYMKLMVGAGAQHEGTDDMKRYDLFFSQPRIVK
jgi:hypothetical protein